MSTELTEDQAKSVIGTCLTEIQIAERYDIWEDEVIEMLLDHNVERCDKCEWWFESGELVTDEDMDEGIVAQEVFCSDCREEFRRGG